MKWIFSLRGFCEDHQLFLMLYKGSQDFQRNVIKLSASNFLEPKNDMDILRCSITLQVKLNRNEREVP